MRWVFPFAVAFLLVIPFANALDTETIFSLEPGAGYKCVYISLPQDLGLTSLSETTETTIELDKTESPWADLTYSRVVMEPGVINKNPVCFYYADREEGEFSFYNIRLSSADLDVSESISGGLCISNYDDVDTGVDAENATDICALLNNNADIIDLSFTEDVTQAKPGDVVTKKLYVTSYANLRIKLSIATSLQNDFGEPVVTTSPSKPASVKTFKVKAPDREGDFEMIVRAQAEGCDLQACKKHKKGVLSVTSKGKEGFTASIIPKNINLKEPQETTFRVVISNYEETQDFLIETSSDPSLEIIPESKNVNVEKDDEKTAVFKVTSGEEDLYNIEFKITSEKSEKLLTSYLSIGEVLNDAYRYSEDVENDYPDIRDEIRNARNQFKSSYNTTSYGDDLNDYEDFRDTVDDLKRTSGNGGNGGNGNGEEDGAGFNWFFLLIPVIIIVVVVLLLFAFKKSKVTSSGYQGYGYSRV